jgi:ribose-phosphate pyrophosphokinase
MVIFGGNSNDPLAREIADILKIELGNIKVGRFNDGEVSIEVKDNVRSKNVYIIQSTSPPVNENLMELLLLVSTMRRASAKKIIAVIPYYGYARQDRKTAPRVPISAADVARLLETVGVDRVILVDVHSGQIQGFFGPRVPVDNLEANLVALNYFVEQKKIPLRDIVVVSPDAGGVTRAKNFQALLTSVGVRGTSLAMIIKQRKAAGEIGTMHLVGNVEGKQAIIIDDIIDTAGTLVEASKVLKNSGALSVSCFATHGLLNGKALDNIRNSQLDQVIVTNSIPAKDNEEAITDGKIRRLSVAPILAEAIFRIETRTSISSLFSIPKT